MDDKDASVEIVPEPQISNRFGFEHDRRILSSTAVKLCVCGCVASLVAVLVCRSPERAPPNPNGGVKTPEASDVSNARYNSKFDSYSESQESQNLKENGRKQVSRRSTNLPGIQKIDRAIIANIPPGSQVRAVLVTGASDGLVRASVTEELKIQGETFIPTGAILLGHGQSAEDRLMIQFTQMTFKDGTTKSIQGQAADSEDQIAGLKGSKVSRYAIKYAAAIGLNFVGGMADGLQNRQAVGGAVVATPDARNALLNGTSRAAIEAANDQMSNLKNQKPVIKVEPGKEILVIFDGGR